MDRDEEEGSPCKKKCRRWVFDCLEEQSMSSSSLCEEEEHRTLELFPLQPEGRLRGLRNWPLIIQPSWLNECGLICFTFLFPLYWERRKTKCLWSVLFHLMLFLTLEPNQSDLSPFICWFQLHVCDFENDGSFWLQEQNTSNEASRLKGEATDAQVHAPTPS